MIRSLRFLPILSLLVLVPDCMAVAHADTPRAVVASPAVDIEVLDTASDHSTHVARFSLALVDGSSGSSTSRLEAQDGSATYKLKAHATVATVAASDTQLSLVISRSDRMPGSGLEVDASFPAKPGARTLVGRIRRSDGHDTEVIATLR